ncbi:hypothetical protein BMS3Bbin04_02060 [bacterium BMS3Bbin04]|nr:hypothetical protein BMS3Bbin04_02060 [bacterium BMS3Bbin04]
MIFDVYCDESQPDLLSSEFPKYKYLVIGSLWLQTEFRENMKQRLHGLRETHRIGAEFKWQKVSTSRSDFFKSLIDLFFSEGAALRFRCILVDNALVDLDRFHDNDHELGFYKFYYQLIKPWILDHNDYNIFLDHKQNKALDRLPILKRCLSYSNITSSVSNLQAIRSEESVLIQFTDFITGIVSSHMNNSIVSSSAKKELIQYFQTKLGHELRPTSRSENKVNIFRIIFEGGW